MVATNSLKPNLFWREATSLGPRPWVGEVARREMTSSGEKAWAGRGVGPGDEDIEESRAAAS